VVMALAPLRAGGAAIAWNQYGHGFPTLEYASLNAAGKPSRAMRISHFSGKDSEAVQISINRRGQLVSSWVHDAGRAHNAHKGFEQLMAAICDSTNRCSAPRVIALGRTRPACVSPAAAAPSRTCSTPLSTDVETPSSSGTSSGRPR